jgi:hypothetical protein
MKATVEELKRQHVQLAETNRALAAEGQQLRQTIDPGSAQAGVR